MTLSWMAVVTSEKQRKEEENDMEVLVFRFFIQLDKSFSYAGKPQKLSTIVIVLYFYSHFSPWDISSQSYKFPKLDY